MREEGSLEVGDGLGELDEQLGDGLGAVHHVVARAHVHLPRETSLFTSEPTLSS